MKKPDEGEKWGAIDWRYMTEESDGEDDTISQHRLPWRSKSMSCVVILYSEDFTCGALGLVPRLPLA